MSTKPTTIPLWATTGTRTAPISSKQATGFVQAERPAGQFLNWLMGYTGDWMQYLNDGNFTGGVSVTGGLTCDTLDITGTFIGGNVAFQGNVVCDLNFNRGSCQKLSLENAILTGAVTQSTSAGGRPVLVTNGGAFTATVLFEVETGRTISGCSVMLNKLDSNTYTVALLRFDAQHDTVTTVGSTTYNGSTGFFEIILPSLAENTGGNYGASSAFYYAVKISASPATSGVPIGPVQVFYSQ